VYSLWLVPKRPLPDDTVHFLPVMRPMTAAEFRASGIAKTDEQRLTWADPAWVEGEPPRFDRGDDADDDADTSRAARRRRERQRRTDSLLVRQRIATPTAIGMPLGRGRVVVVADPDWLRNDVVRVCRWNAAVASVRLLEWLVEREDGAPLPRHVVFDEWHQGRGIHPSALGALGTFVTRDPRGRALAQGVVALLVLLAAVAARPLVPTGRARVERRSPFEHVGALARAYEEIGATRVVTRRLVRGLRRRLGSTATARDEETLLAALEARHPALAPEVALVRTALATPQSPASLLEVGRAVATIERTVLRS
jgi:hypothetical protein